jgi:SAM-dependent methyltransferase
MLFPAGIPQERRRSERMFIDNVTPGALLDVGCGSGRFLSVMSKRGWKVMGVDFDPAAVEAARARGLEVYVGTAGSMLDKGSKFDIVTASHVIEHVPDPVEFLSQCRRLLHPGGRLVLKTPNAGSFGARRYGPAWRGLEPPRHLHIFSMQALENCAQRAGFTRRHVFTSSVGAGGMLMASYFLARKGAYRAHDLSRLEFLLSKIFELWYAVQGKLAWALDRRSGEEICAVLGNDPPAPSR